MTDNRTTIDEDAARLHAAARDEVAARYGNGRRWSLWVELSWRWSVSESRAVHDVEEWAIQLWERVRGSAIVVGIHNDTGRLHGHALVYVPRGNAPPNPKRSVWLRALATAWHQERWPHGLLWLDRYEPTLARRPDGKHGTTLYIAKDPGSVMAFGEAPIYQPRRSRRR